MRSRLAIFAVLVILIGFGYAYLLANDQRIQTRFMQEHGCLVGEQAHSNPDSADSFIVCKDGTRLQPTITP